MKVDVFLHLTFIRYFSHLGVIAYCKRPYAIVEEMNEALIKLWNETIGKDDTIYVLGDFSLSRNAVIDITPKLNGNKILIAGNHDKCFNFAPKENTKQAIEGAERRYKKGCDLYIQNGWQEVHQTLEFTLKNGQNVLMSHLPYAPKEIEEFDRRYMSYRPKDEGKFLLCGHQHGRYIKYNNMIDVGIDAHQKILSEDEIISYINDERNYIESVLTKWYNDQKGKENESNS